MPRRKSGDRAAPESPRTLPRRALLAATMASAAALRLPSAAEPERPSPTASDLDGRSPQYRETEHVLRFYARSRF
jgi:hypothetical protein